VIDHAASGFGRSGTILGFRCEKTGWSSADERLLRFHVDDGKMGSDPASMTIESPET